MKLPFWFGVVLTSLVATKDVAVVNAQSDSTPCSGEIDETTYVTHLNFLNSDVTNNTLHLPGGELRYANVGTVRDRPVDLSVTVASGDYTDILRYWQRRKKKILKMNGLKKKGGGRFANINLQTIKGKPKSGEGNFKFCFHDRETNELVKVDKFHWSVYDLDQRGDDEVEVGIGLKEKIIMDTSQAKAYQLWPNESESEVKLSCEDGTDIPCAQGVRTVFHSSKAGTGKDNPTDPAHLKDIQKLRSVAFTFEDTDCWTFTYDHFCPVEQDREKVFPLGYDPRLNNRNRGHCRGPYTGGNFLFSGDADEIISEGECITPPPTAAPLPTSSPTEETQFPTESPWFNRTLPPVPVNTFTLLDEEPPVASTTFTVLDEEPQHPGHMCFRDVFVKKKMGETEYPLTPTKPVKIVNVGSDEYVCRAKTKEELGRTNTVKDENCEPCAYGYDGWPCDPGSIYACICEGTKGDSVTVDLSQSWTGSGSSVGHIFASYKENYYKQVCVEAKDPIGGGAVFDTITIQCNMLSPRAYLEICVADDLSNGALTAGDNAKIPNCCLPDIPSGYKTVCYTLEINCSFECIDQLEDRRFLRGNEKN